MCNSLPSGVSFPSSFLVLDTFKCESRTNQDAGWAVSGPFSFSFSPSFSFSFRSLTNDQNFFLCPVRDYRLELYSAKAGNCLRDSDWMPHWRAILATKCAYLLDSTSRLICSPELTVPTVPSDLNLFGTAFYWL